jgi:hypothetical protein
MFYNNFYVFLLFSDYTQIFSIILNSVFLIYSSGDLFLSDLEDEIPDLELSQMNKLKVYLSVFFYMIGPVAFWILFAAYQKSGTLIFLIIIVSLNYLIYHNRNETALERFSFTHLRTSTSQIFR